MELESLPWYGQFAIFMLVGLVLFGFFYFLIYSPKTSEISNLETKIQELDDKLNLATRIEEQLDKLRLERKELEGKLEQLKSIMPEKKELDQMLRKIQSLASTARLRIDDISPKSTRQKEIYEEWPTDLNVECNFHNLAIFFFSLSKQSKIYNVDSVTITPLPMMSEEYTIKATFTTTTYIYHEIEKPRLPPKSTRQKPPATKEKEVDNIGILP